MSLAHTVAFLGFSEFERNTLATYFRLAGKRTPSYEQVVTLTDADFLVADADHAPSVQLVTVTERLAETVFIGTHQPAGASAWMARPIDPLHVMRELDAMVAAAPRHGWPASPARAPLPKRWPGWCRRPRLPWPLCRRRRSGPRRSAAATRVRRAR